MNMRYVTAWVAALVCAGLGSSSLLATLAQGGTVEVTLTVDWGVLQTPISPALVGASVSADHQGNGMAVNGIAASAVASTAALRAKMLRFPDDISQSYHWKSAGVEGRLSTLEFWSLSDDADVPNTMVTVNMANGAPDEAALWVAMANQPPGSPNTTTRPTQPFDIGYWMLGEDIRDMPVKYPTAQAYATAALENASLMRAASPEIKIGVWLADGTSPDGALWNSALLTNIKLFDPGQNATAGQRLIDFVAVSVDVEVPNRPLTDAALYPSLYGYAAARADQVVLAAEQVVSSVLRNELPIAVYRYAIDFGSEGWNQDKADSLGTAIALTGMLNAFARHPKVFTAIYAGLNRDGFGALLQVPSAFDVAAESRFALNPFGQVFASFGQFLTGSSLGVDLQGAGASAAKAFYKAPPIGRMPSTERVGLLSVEAALDAQAGQMALFVASRSTADRVVARVVVANAAPALVNASMVANTLGATALSTDSYSGILHLEPHSEVRNLAFEEAPDGSYIFELTIPRNSISLFTFSVGF